MLISRIGAEHIDTVVELSGWVQNWRSSGKLYFLELRDGSGFIQIVADESVLGPESFLRVKALSLESSVVVSGKVTKHPKTGEHELQAIVVHPIQIAAEYPIGKKEHGPDFLLEHRHLWLRSPSQWAIQRVRDRIVRATNEWFEENGFVKIDSPILTPAACEGTTELFTVPYFDQSAYLSQSGQLYLEAAIMAHGRVYDFGPVFRAEKSKTRRHLTEFWMMDAEMAFVDHAGNLEVQEKLVVHIVGDVLKHCAKELSILGRDVNLLEKVQAPFPRLTHQEAVVMLRKLGSDIGERDDFGADDETLLTKQFDRPIFVEKYPAEVKAFYMKPDPTDPSRVLNADLLAPEGYGEVIGGSQREDEYEKLLSKIHEHQLPVEAFDWYLDTRKYGSVPHSGFGYGLERLIAWICGIQHVRETIPFPRTINRLKP